MTYRRLGLTCSFFLALASTLCAQQVAPPRQRVATRPALAQNDSNEQDSEPLPEKDETAKLFDLTPINAIQLDPRALNHPAPQNQPQGLDPRRFADLRELRMEQGWTAQTVHWCATNFAHRPLYFEDVLLERHGQARHPCTQPLWSAAHFFGAVPILPYKMGLDRPWDCVYTLGRHRPGNCKPSYRRRFVWENDAAAFESSAWVAALLLLP